MVVTTSWYAVVMPSFCIAFSCLKVGICNCTVIWIRSCMAFYYLDAQLYGGHSIQYCAYGEISATAYLVVQLHIMTLRQPRTCSYSLDNGLMQWQGLLTPCILTPVFRWIFCCAVCREVLQGKANLIQSWIYGCRVLCQKTSPRELAQAVGCYFTIAIYKVSIQPAGDTAQLYVNISVFLL